jgi:hypothetical protein
MANKQKGVTKLCWLRSAQSNSVFDIDRRVRISGQYRPVFAKLKRSAHTLSPRGDDKTFVYCYAALSASKSARAFLPSLAASAMLSKKTDERSIGAEQQAR